MKWCEVMKVCYSKVYSFASKINVIYVVLVVAAVLDFHNLHQMSLVLSEAELASDAAFTVKEHFSTTPGLNTLPEVCMHTIT